MTKRPLKESPSQTAGPYVHIGCVPNTAGIDGVYPKDLGADMGGAGIPIVIEGIVYDGTGAPVCDAMIEMWQADGSGTYHPGSGFGRVAVNGETGLWSIHTVKPGPTTDQAPHITLWIVARGINIGLHTRLYFPDADNSADLVLAQVPQDRRATLIATATHPGTYRFDIHLQGDAETVFFDM